MGSGIVKNLLNSGHKVIIWNRDPSKSRKFEEIGAQVAMTPCDVAEQVDIIFSCVSDPLASKEVITLFTLSFDVLKHFKSNILDCLRQLRNHFIQSTF